MSAREHVRVAHRLQELPLIRAAFAEGQLSYSKVRALTRVENVEREQDLLNLARHATASQLERLVRAYRGAVAIEQVARGERPGRWLTWSHDDDGSLMLRGRLPAEEGALVVAALEAARDRLRETAEPASAEAPGEDSSASSDRTASAEAPDPDRGASSENPASAEAHEAKPAERPASAEASDATAGEARADALVLLADAFAAGEEAERTGGDRYQVVVHVDTTTLRGTERGETCELDADAPLAADTARRLACDAAIVPLLERAGKPLSVGRKTRSIPPALRRALAARDRGCRFPGCGARRFVDAHHIEHWAHGGPTSLPNLIHVCRHHHRLLHEGGYTVDRHKDGRFTFRRPDGRRIAACPRPPRGEEAALRARRRAIAADACVSLSAGEKMDLDLGVEAMLLWAPPPATDEPPGI